MGKFKVGDRVRVVNDKGLGRPKNYSGDECDVIKASEVPGYILLAPDGEYWHFQEDEIEPIAPSSPEITLRDQFAMAALTGLMQGLPQGWGNDIDQIATDRCSDAYIFADAMLAERERTK